MFRSRLLSGSLLGAAVIASILWLPTALVPFLIAAVCLISMLEFYALLDAANLPNYHWSGACGGVALILITSYLPRLVDISFFEAEGIALFGLIAWLMVRQFFQKDNPRPLETIAGTMLGIMYIAFLFNFLTKLSLQWGDLEGRLAIFYFVVVVKFTDIGAYFTGCTFGKHKLIPRISPKKTWEGCLGGVIVANLVSLFAYWLATKFLGYHNVRLIDAVILGTLLSVVGIVGDLAESFFKRSAGVKDSGSFIRGMGGILDVVDSLLLTAPVLYLYIRFIICPA